MATQAESNHIIYMERHKEAAERDHHGEVALMVDGKIIDYFTSESDAYTTGRDRYGLGNFSIELVGAAPIDLGIQALAFI